MADVDISLYDEVTCEESITALVSYPIITTVIPPLYAPTASLVAGGAYGANLDAKAPVATLLAYPGAHLDKKAPVAVAVVEGIFPVFLTLDAYAPIAVMSGFTGGARCEGKFPAATCLATSYSNHAELDWYAPTATCEASIYEEQFLSLNKKSPYYILEAVMFGVSNQLSSVSPVWYGISISGLTVEAWNLDANAPVASIEYEDLLLFYFGISLDANAPIGTMTEDTGAGDADPAVMSDATLFDDYTLEYSR